MSDLATAALPAATAIIGIGFGWMAGRGRERRDLRASAYLEWMQAARLAVTWPIDEKPPSQGATVPHPRMQLRLVNAVAGVELVGSEKVVKAAREYLEAVDDTGHAMEDQGATLNEMVEAIDVGLRPQRQGVVELMRHDLKTKR